MCLRSGSSATVLEIQQKHGNSYKSVNDFKQIIIYRWHDTSFLSSFNVFSSCLLHFSHLLFIQTEEMQSLENKYSNRKK